MDGKTVHRLGILDKNGKEILSNSKVDFEGHKGKIFYSKTECRFKIAWNDGGFRGMSESFGKKLAVL